MLRKFNSSMYTKFHASSSASFELALEHGNDEDPDDPPVVIDEVEMNDKDDIEDEDYVQLLTMFGNGDFNGEVVTLHAV